MSQFSPEQIDRIAVRARALGDGTRVRILTALARGEQVVGQIAEATGAQQSTVSKHLQVLFHAGLVERQRAAATVRYWLASPDMLDWLRYLGAARPVDPMRKASRPVRKADSTAKREKSRV